MIYITVPFTERHKHISLQDLLFNDNLQVQITKNQTATITYAREDVSDAMKDKVSHTIVDTIAALSQFAVNFEHLYAVQRTELYETFHIPKKSGGLRRIDAPVESLKNALRFLKQIIESSGAMYHTSAFAYISGRSTIDAVKKHQQNESKWFAKFDLHNFFGSTTPDFVLNMFSQVYPFSEVIDNPIGNEAFRKAFDLAFLNGGLPQGTPVSPTITNVMMIPFDFMFTKYCREHNLIYTRYADDFIVSSRTQFNCREVEQEICRILRGLGAPFELNPQKTRYGSSAGSNWNLGVMLNKDNDITVGHKNKRRLETMLFNYSMDRQHGNPWSLEDIQTLRGLISYYKMVEGETIERIVAHMSRKTNLDILAAIKADLNPTGGD